jgi:NodT family efflux transporter outer membrane factor (OMF) lipoprotein
MAAIWTGMPLVVLLALAACAVGPDYQPQAAALVPFHNAKAVQARNPANLAPLDTWWVAFKDPTLDRLVGRALAQNLDLAESFARVQQARAAASSAGAQLLPTLDATGQATALRQSLNSPLGRIGETLPGYDRDQRLYDVGAAASWEIDIAGGLRRGKEAADAVAQAAVAEMTGVRITVAADVADAYFQIRRDQLRIATVQQQVDVDAHLVRLVRQLRGRGLADERQASQAAAVLAQAQAALPPLRIELEGQLNRLDVLLGVQPGMLAATLARPGDNAVMPAIPDTDRPVEFLRRRPDIVAAERQLAAANARIGQALSDYYPKLSVSGLLGFDGLSANRLFTAASFQPAVTGALRWRIFDFGKVDAEVAAARGAHSEALARYRRTVLRAAEEVEDAFKGVVELEGRTAQLEAEVQSLQRSRDLSQQAFTAGSIPLTDVLDADRQLLATRDALVQNRADAMRAVVCSFRALGGGWSA